MRGFPVRRRMLDTRSFGFFQVGLGHEIGFVTQWI